MVRQAKGFGLNLGPVKKELLDFAQGFGVLTAQLSTFMTALNGAQRASTGFGNNPLLGQVMNTPNQGVGYQTPTGMQAQAAAQAAGWQQQPSYQQQFSGMMQAALSKTPVADFGFDQSREDSVTAARDAIRHATAMARDTRRTSNAVSIHANEDVSKAVAAGPILKTLIEDMQASGMTPAMAALEIKRTPGADRALSGLPNNGFIRHAKMLAEKPLEEIESEVAKQREITVSRQKARLEREEALKTQAETDRNDTVKRGFNTQFQTGDRAREAMTRAAVMGDKSYTYGSGSIVQARNIMSQGPQDDILKFTEKLKNAGNIIDRDFGGQLEAATTHFNALAKSIKDLTLAAEDKNLSEAGLKQVKADLAVASGNLIAADEARREAAEQAGMGNGGGAGGGRFGGLNRKLPAVQAIAGMALAAADLGFGVHNNMVRQNLGSELRAMGSEADSAQILFRRKVEQADTANVENRLKYNADQMLSPNQLVGAFVGRQGQQRALNVSLDQVTRTLKQEGTEANQQLIKGGVGIGLGAVMTAGSAAVGMENPMAGIMGAQAGVGMMMGGTGQISSVFNSRNEMITRGGIAGTGIGQSLTGTAVGDYLNLRPGMVEENKREARAGVTLDTLTGMNQGSDSWLRAHPEIVEGYKGLEATRQARLQGNAIVGGYAVSGFTREMEAGMLEARAAGVKASADSATDYAKAQAAADAGLKRIDAEHAELPAQWRHRGRERAERDAATLEGVRASIAATGVNFNENAGLTEFGHPERFAARRSDEAIARFYENDRSRDALYRETGGKNIAEMSQERNILSNFVGGQASEKDAANIVGLSRVGFGSKEQLLGNLQGLNQARGGQNNIEALKESLAYAVSSGFDKSRMAQQFVTSTTELAQSIGAVDTGTIAKRVSNLIGPGGEGDERRLQQALSGEQGLAEFTSRTSGAVGMAKLGALTAAGATPRNGLISLMTNSSAKSEADLKILNDAKTPDDIKDRELHAFAVRNGLPKARRMMEAGGDAGSLLATNISQKYDDQGKRITEKQFLALPPERRAKALEQTAEQNALESQVMVPFNTGYDANTQALRKKYPKLFESTNQVPLAPGKEDVKYDFAKFYQSRLEGDRDQSAEQTARLSDKLTLTAAATSQATTLEKASDSLGLVAKPSAVPGAAPGTPGEANVNMSLDSAKAIGDAIGRAMLSSGPFNDAMASLRNAGLEILMGHR